MTVNLSMFAGAGAQFFDNNGVPLAGGLIYTYLAGTTTPAATYTSSTGLIAHSNPIVLNAAGRIATGEIWLTQGVSYKFILYTSANVLIGSYDNVSGVFDSQQLSNTTDPTLGDALVGFRQSNAVGNLTGAIGRTVHQKLQESVSVKDFGAVGDGVTNDTAAINAAIESVFSQGGGTVYVPEGEYALGTSGSFFAVILRANVWLKGAGTAGTILKLLPNANSRNVQFKEGEHNMQLTDMTLDGNKLNQTNTGLIALRMQGNHNVLVSNVRVTNSSAYGLGVAFTVGVEENIQDGRFENLEIDNNGDDGFDGKRTARCVFQNIYTHDNAGRGIDIRGDQNIYDNIWAYRNTTGISFRALGTQPSSISTEHYVKATNCYAFDNSDIGYFIANNEPPLVGFKSEYDLVNCHAYNNTNGGFQHRGSEMVVRYVNCTAKENGTIGFRVSATSSNLTTTGIFTNCVAIDNGSAGIVVDNGVGPHYFSNCIAYGNTSTTGQVALSAENCQWLGGSVKATNSVLTITVGALAENVRIIGGVFDNGTSNENLRIDGPNAVVIGASFIHNGSGSALRIQSTSTNSAVIGCDFTNVTAGTKLLNNATSLNVEGCTSLPNAFKNEFVTTAVNFFTALPGSSGVSPLIQADGVDTDLDIRFAPKGAGKVSFGGHTGSADAPISGYVEIKDASGVIRKLAVIS